PPVSNSFMSHGTRMHSYLESLQPNIAGELSKAKTLPRAWRPFTRNANPAGPRRNNAADDLVVAGGWRRLRGDRAVAWPQAAGGNLPRPLGCSTHLREEH